MKTAPPHLFLCGSAFLVTLLDLHLPFFGFSRGTSGGRSPARSEVWNQKKIVLTFLRQRRCGYP